MTAFAFRTKFQPGGFQYSREIQLSKWKSGRNLPHRFGGLLPINSWKILSKMTRMKKQILVLLFAGVCVYLGATSALAINIMPMGDSVTSRGSTPESSYRYWLWQKLLAAGFTDIDFVGNQSGVSDGAPANTDFDQDYEGGGSDNDAWGTEDGIEHIGDANSRSPDIVLLDLGSNDYNPDVDLNSNIAQIQANLETIINGLAAANPNIIVLLAKPTPFETTDRGEKKFMSKLASGMSKVARDEKKAGVNVTTVGLFGSFNARKDTVDGTHPNVLGEQRIASKYFSALKKILKRLQ
jgi:acyl-CoA thioesterase-1